MNYSVDLFIHSLPAVAFAGSLLGLRNHYSTHMWSAFPQGIYTGFKALRQTKQWVDMPSQFCLFFNEAASVRRLKRNVRGRLGSFVSPCDTLLLLLTKHSFEVSNLFHLFHLFRR